MFSYSQLNPFYAITMPPKNPKHVHITLSMTTTWREHLHITPAEMAIMKASIAQSMIGGHKAPTVCEELKHFWRLESFSVAFILIAV